jgi:hypothetical protein
MGVKSIVYIHIIIFESVIKQDIGEIDLPIKFTDFKALIPFSKSFELNSHILSLEFKPLL